MTWKDPYIPLLGTDICSRISILRGWKYLDDWKPNSCPNISNPSILGLHKEFESEGFSSLLLKFTQDGVYIGNTKTLAIGGECFFDSFLFSEEWFKVNPPGVIMICLQSTFDFFVKFFALRRFFVPFRDNFSMRTKSRISCHFASICDSLFFSMCPNFDQVKSYKNDMFSWLTPSFWQKTPEALF